MQIKIAIRNLLTSFGRTSRVAISQAPGKGLVYVSADEDSPLAEARPGAEIRNPNRHRPWIVVNHDATSVIAVKWPGKLWAVDIIDPATAADQAEVGGPPMAYAGYTRAVGVLVTEELPLSMLFGPHGEAVCQVIEVARALTRDRATILSESRHPDAGRTYDRAFRAWLTDQGLPIYAWEEDFDGTLDARREGSRIGSPILGGLGIVHDQVAKRAASFDGDDAFTTDDNEDSWLVRPWSGAGSALCDAALALGAPELVGPADHKILTTAWAALQPKS